MKAIARRTPLDLSKPCRLWEGWVARHGYGLIMIDSKERYVHRVTYQLHVGPIPRGWQVDHVCHNAAALRGECEGGDSCPHRSCWEPAHLEAVSNAENSRRGNHPLVVISRSNRCRKGHDLTDPANVRLRADGRRRCRVCDLEGQRERRARSKP